MATTSAPDGPAAGYDAAAERHGAGLAEMRGRVRRLEAARLTTFVVGAVVGALYADLPIGRAASLSFASVAAVVFVVLVMRHRRLRRLVRRLEVAESLARLGRSRLGRDWAAIAKEHERLGYADPMLDEAAARDTRHSYSADLDLFGGASVRALLGPTPTATGVVTLRGWLTSAAEPDEIERRQGAVRALAADIAGREELAVESFLVEGVREHEWVGFRAWLREPPILEPSETGGGPLLPAWGPWVARVLPPVTLGLFLLDVVAGMVPTWWVWGGPLAVQTALAWRWGRGLHGYFARASGTSGGLRRYQSLLAAWERYRCDEPTIQTLRRRLTGSGDAPASGEIRRLERWLDAADSRASSLHFVFAAGFLWDVHVAAGLERWRVGSGARVEDWFEALGELEALTALATVAHDHPAWTFPVVRDGAPGLEAEGLGHPLLPEAVLRTGDVAVDPPGRFLLVTGSNMSGKSTLLRSLGLAAVLAQAGSVVCATRLRMSPLRVFTSMRIGDSLTRGVSHFMAELERLKALVDAADGGGPEAPALLYLIDEVLQGTNSEERRVAARRIVAHLLEARAVGAVTTHDLTLHEDSRLDEAATKVHFRETVQEGAAGAVITFDYRLRPGLATSRNALKLLELVGLPAAEPES